MTHVASSRLSPHRTLGRGHVPLPQASYLDYASGVGLGHVKLLSAPPAEASSKKTAGTWRLILDGWGHTARTPIWSMPLMRVCRIKLATVERQQHRGGGRLLWFGPPARVSSAFQACNPRESSPSLSPAHPHTPTGRRIGLRRRRLSSGLRTSQQGAGYYAANSTPEVIDHSG